MKNCRNSREILEFEITNLALISNLSHLSFPEFGEWMYVSEDLVARILAVDVRLVDAAVRAPFRFKFWPELAKCTALCRERERGMTSSPVLERSNSSSNSICVPLSSLSLSTSHSQEEAAALKRASKEQTRSTGMQKQQQRQITATKTTATTPYTAL